MIQVEAFACRMSRLRAEKGLTQADLAKSLGVTPQAISKWEKGQSFPDVSRLDELAELLEVTLSYLLTGKS